MEPCDLAGSSVSEEPNATILSLKELSTLKTEAVCSNEMLLPVYQTTQCHVSEDSDIRFDLRLVYAG
jgi:hypothetical protein